MLGVENEKPVPLALALPLPLPPPLPAGGPPCCVASPEKNPNDWSAPQLALSV
jgi:hypothetical protein